MKIFYLLFCATCGILQVVSLRIDCAENNENGTCSVKNLEVKGESESISTVANNGIEDIDDLHVFNQRVKYLPTNVGEKFPQLTSLRIERSGLQKIERSSFRKLNELETLSLWNNDIQSLNYDTFDDLPMLKHLDLNDNNIEELDRRIFNKLQALTILNLDSNYLKSLDPMLFRSNKDLKHLSIQKNALKELPITIFEKLEKLQILNLDNNELEGLPDQLFRTNLQLRELTVADNSIESVGAENRERLMNLELHNFLFNPCTKNLNQEATNEELLAVLEEACKTEPPMRIKWLETEINELRRSKREDAEFIKCAELEFLRNDDNINSTRDAILQSITSLSSLKSNTDDSLLQSDVALMKKTLTNVETVAAQIDQALKNEDSKVNINFKTLRDLVSSEKGLIDAKIEDKIARVKAKIDAKVLEILTKIGDHAETQDSRRGILKTDLESHFNTKLETEGKKVSDNVNAKISGVDSKINGQDTQLIDMKSKIEDIVGKVAKLTEIDTKVNGLVEKAEKITKCNFYQLSFDFIHSVAPFVDGIDKFKNLIKEIYELKSKVNESYNIDINIKMKTDGTYEPAYENTFRKALETNCGMKATS